MCPIPYYETMRHSKSPDDRTEECPQICLLSLNLGAA